MLNSLYQSHHTPIVPRFIRNLRWCCEAYGHVKINLSHVCKGEDPAQYARKGRRSHGLTLPQAVRLFAPELLREGLVSFFDDPEKHRLDPPIAPVGIIQQGEPSGQESG